VSRGPGKCFVDIEHALRWAYRDELPKRSTLPQGRATRTQERVWSPYTYPAGYPEASPSFREAVGGGPSGGYADGWSRDPGFPIALGGPHVDALVIEEAVRELAAWRGYSFGADDPAGLTHGFEGLEVDHLQAAVAAIAAMPGIVAVHARAGTRPTWSKDTPTPYPDNGGNGKPRVLIDEAFVEKYDDRGRLYHEPEAHPEEGAVFFREPMPCPPTRKGWYRTGAYCPLKWDPPPEPIVTQRAEYAAWRMGLELLHRALEGRLESIAPLPPAAPWRPWAGELEEHGRPPELFKALRGEPYRRETREQAAAKRRAAVRRQQGPRTEQTRPVTRAPAGRRREDGTNGA
jgi:hypothetical protein